jgi:hypothetical protein
MNFKENLLNFFLTIFWFIFINNAKGYKVTYNDSYKFDLNITSF